MLQLVSVPFGVFSFWILTLTCCSTRFHMQMSSSSGWTLPFGGGSFFFLLQGKEEGSNCIFLSWGSLQTSTAAVAFIAYHGMISFVALKVPSLGTCYFAEYC